MDLKTTRHLAGIVNTMREGLLLVGTDGTIQMVNPALERMTGFTARELVGASCAIFGCDACQQARNDCTDHWCRLFGLKPGEESSKRCHITRKDGTYLHVLKSASLLRDEDGTVLGAVETLTDISELDVRDRKIRELHRALEQQADCCGMIGRSPAMKMVYDLLERASGSDAPVILYGESGTGKELAARALHELSPRAEAPYVQVNCAALNESLLESELFGHVRGAFTGAYKHRTGRFEEAGEGDIFLDEIGDVPPGMQVKLLRVLETRTFERVGDNRPLRLNARIITATNQDLRALAAQGRFREDFFYRINVIPIHLPPLRQRSGDVVLLTDHFVRRFNAAHDRDISGLTPEALRLFTEYSWPGNVRELRSALEYAFVVCESGAIDVHHLPRDLARTAAAAPEQSCTVSAHAPSGANASPQSAEREELIHALEQTGGNKSAAARMLGINRVTVLNRMRKYGIDLKKVVTS